MSAVQLMRTWEDKDEDGTKKERCTETANIGTQRAYLRSEVAVKDIRVSEQADVSSLTMGSARE